MSVLSGLRRGAGRRDLGTNVRLVLYVGACLAVLFYLLSLIGAIDFFSKRTAYQARIPDVSGLRTGDAVKIAGVAVGKVTGIHLKQGKAIVDFNVDSKTKLRAGTSVGVRWRSLIGQKYLYVYPAKQGRVLPAHAMIDKYVESPDVGRFLNAVGPVLQAVDPKKANALIEALDQGLSGNDQRVRDLLSNTATISRAIGGTDQQVSSLLSNLRDVVGQIASRNQDLGATIGNLRTLAGKVAARNDSLDTLLDQFGGFTGSLDKLLTERTGDLDSTITNLRSVASVLSKHHDDLDTALATLPNGLAQYQLISQGGQWFEANFLYLCMAGSDQAQGGLLPCVSRSVLADTVSGQLPTDVKPMLDSVFWFAAEGPST